MKTLGHAWRALALLLLGNLLAAAAALASVHPVRFFIDPALAASTPQPELARRLGQYVADLNAVYARQTTRSFSFDPATGVVISSAPLVTAPPAGEFWHVVGKSTTSYSFGGRAPVLTSGAGGVASGYRWTQIYDPATLTPDQLGDYMNGQLLPLLHETGHLFGLALSEFYRISATDVSGIAPVIDLNLNRSLTQLDDPYFASRPLYLRDPMANTSLFGDARLPATPTRELAVAAVEFTAGNKVMASTDWVLRPPFDRQSAVDVAARSTHVVAKDARTGVAIAGATVKVFRYLAATPADPAFNILARPPRLVALLDSASVNPSVFAWAPAWMENGILLVKASAPGYAPETAWFTVHDAFEQLHVQGLPGISIEVGLTALETTPPVVSMTAPLPGVVVEAGAPMRIAAAASDNGAVQQVAFSLNGSVRCVDLVSQPYACDLSAPAVGTHQVQITATDKSGNNASSFGTFVAVDRTAPKGVWRQPAAAGWVAAGGQAVLEVVVNEFSGLAQVSFLANGRRACTLPATSIPQGQVIDFPLSCVWKVPSARTASYALQAQLTDIHGNVANVPLTVNAWSAPPTLNVASPLDRAVAPNGSTLNISASANSPVGVASMEALVDRVAVCSSSGASLNCAHTVAARGGSLSVEVRATDTAGNVARQTLSVRTR